MVESVVVSRFDSFGMRGSFLPSPRNGDPGRTQQPLVDDIAILENLHDGARIVFVILHLHYGFVQGRIELCSERLDPADSKPLKR